jgi:hypothetical protein
MNQSEAKSSGPIVLELEPGTRSLLWTFGGEVGVEYLANNILGYR